MAPTPFAWPEKHNTDMGFDEWVIFVFDHPIDEDIRSAWYYNDELNEFWDEWDELSNPEKQLDYATRLFQNPAFLLNSYSPEQINQGFWLLLVGKPGFSLEDIIWNIEVSWALREQCVLSMVNVFRIIFTAMPEQDSCNMWWDLIRDFRNRDERIKETMLQAMASILEMPLLDFQVSALHGLGHLNHSGKRTVIENYLAKSPNVDLEIWPDMDITVREYALAAIESKVL